ncbi:hypothetical protein JCM6882_006685 [Rhodosporidiobolus microsporus]
MAPWLDLRILSTATSYALSPAYYCSSVFWTALGYFPRSPTSHDRLLAALATSSSQRTLAPAPAPLSTPSEEGAAAPEAELGAREERLERWEGERVERALREAMREDEEEDSAEGGVGLCLGEAAREEDAEARGEDDDERDVPSPSPLTSPSTSPTRPSLHPSPSLRLRPDRPLTPLTPLHRLSRRSTLCLSTLYRLSSSPSLSPLPPGGSSPKEQEDVVAALDAAATAAEEAGQTEGIEGGVAGKKEREMVERVLEEEVQKVRGDVERAVEEAVALVDDGVVEEERKVREQEEQEEQGEAEEKGEAVGEARRRSTVVEGSWAEVASLSEREKDEALTGQVATQTWFSSPAGQAFSSIPISPSEGIDTAAFLRAMESMQRLMSLDLLLAELLAPAAASLCAADVRLDIARLQSRLTSHPSTSRTLQALLRSERRERKRPATESAVWLIRLLKFASTAFRFSLDSPEKEELSVSFTRAWEDDFSRHVNWLVRPLFKVILRACPPRASIYSKLAQGAPPAQLEREMRQWVAAVERVVDGVEGFLRREKVRV